MAIGFWELLLLTPLLVVLIVVAVWGLRSSGGSGGRRSTADRLAELESLRNAGRISADEYEKQRASIISSV